MIVKPLTHIRLGVSYRVFYIQEPNSKLWFRWFFFDEAYAQWVVRKLFIRDEQDREAYWCACPQDCTPADTPTKRLKI